MPSRTANKINKQEKWKNRPISSNYHGFSIFNSIHDTIATYNNNKIDRIDKITKEARRNGMSHKHEIDRKVIQENGNLTYGIVTRIVCVILRIGNVRDKSEFAYVPPSTDK